MYCSGCGLDLPDEALSCPNCGKRRIQDEPVSSPVPLETSPAASERSKDGRRSLESDSPAKPESAAPSTVDGRKRHQHANGGSITLGAAALICLVLSAAQGFIPVFLLLCLAFGGLAWLCAVWWPLSGGFHATVLAASLLLSTLVGVSLDRDSFGPRYRYLSQGSVQYRVDEKAGRTDRLGNGGWYPVAYDREAQQMPANGPLTQIELTNGEWTPWSVSPLGGQICFLAKNASDYILDRITISVRILKKTDAAAGQDSAPDLYSRVSGPQVVLKSYGGGLIAAGETRLACGSAPRDLSAKETWSYEYINAYGWKR
jgi:hypothetical protein